MLRATDLHFAYYPSRAVLRGLDLELPSATFTAILGPNGCGKSTLLRLLLGSLSPTRGQCTLESTPTHTLTSQTRASRIAFLAQRPELPEAVSLRHYLRLGRFALHRDDAACDDAARTVDLHDRLDDAVATLSAGQQQRAALARVLAQLHHGDATKQFVLADEPAASQDPAHTLFTLRTLSSLADRGTGVIVVLHDPALALAFADRAVLITATGKLLAQGPARDTLTPATLSELFGVRYHAVNPTPALASLVLDPRTP